MKIMTKKAFFLQRLIDKVHKLVADLYSSDIC